MRWNVVVCLWAGLVWGCAGAASAEAGGSGSPDAGTLRSGREKGDAGVGDEAPQPLPVSGCGEVVGECPGGPGGTPSSEPPAPLSPMDNPQGPGPDPSPIDGPAAQGAAASATSAASLAA
jgi:hypothetical protein